MIKKLILIGGGGHCRSCIETIESTQQYAIEGILDVREKVGQEISGYPVIGVDEDLEKYVDEDIYFLITVGQIRSNTIRLKLYEKLKALKLRLATITASTAYVSKRCVIGEGTIVMHHAIVNAGVTIGANNIINNKVLVEHDVQIGDHCHISTGAILNGGVQVSNHVFVGSGCVTREYITIQEGAFIKANSLVK
jgi:sugar O-acyltransferase (sialic acid O-acetyltransferase NeuD family)